ncbi:MAG: hypothetical protein NTY66_03765 [Candidatus Vogelbacteria bacterium]|nr:hypothetical protein [Candidatus Vogelbacteria bacterium]
MRNNILRLAIFLVALSVSFSALPALAIYADPPAGVTPSNCPANVEGCNTPINVSGYSQTKAGNLTIQGMLNAGTTTITKWYSWSGTAPWGVYQPDVNILATVKNSRTQDMGGSIGFTDSTAGGFLYAAIKGAPTNSIAPGGGHNFGGYLGFFTVSDTSGSSKNGDNVWTYEKMRITEDGIVGINTMAPNAANKLEVAGRVAASGPAGDFCIDKSKNGPTGDICLSTMTAGNNLPAGTSGQTLRHDGTGWVANTLLYNNGTNIGINYGGNTPGSRLSVYGDIYTYVDSVNGTALAALSNGTGETYGAKLIGTKIGSFNKGVVGLYATDMGHAGTGTRDNRIPAALDGSRQWAGYFDGDVNINGGLYIDGNRITNFGGSNLPAGVMGNTLYYGLNGWTASSNIYNASGFVGIGTAAPSAKLDVAGKAKVTQLQVGSSAVAGQVLTADTSGNATWQTPATGGNTGISRLNQGMGIILSPSPITTVGSVSVDFNTVQRRVSNSCTVGSAIRSIAADGTVVCEPTTKSVVTVTNNTKIYSGNRWIKVESYCPGNTVRTGCSAYQSDCEESDCGNHGVKPITNGCQGWFDNDGSVEDRVDAYCLSQ